MARLIRCKLGALPFIYLGLPVGKDMSKCASWSNVIERFSNRLSMWKGRLLSIGGRCTLTKAVLGSLPLYYLSVFRAPCKVIDCLERIRSRFFWGLKEGENSLVWVKWKAVLADCDRGGLGIGSIKAKNISLLSKWWWRFKSEKDAGSWSWRINLRGRYKSDLQLLISYLNGVELHDGVKDGLLWNLDQQHSFSVKKLASLIDSNILKDHWFGSKSHAWSLLVPKKINIHIWRLATDRLPLLPKLLRFGINVASVMCPLCNEVPESIEHIMVYCPKVNTIWLKCFSWWGLKPSYRDMSVKSLIDGTFCSHLPKIAQSVFVGVCYSAFWAIWRWRNKVWHSSVEEKVMELGVDTFAAIQSCSFLWITNQNSKINVDWKTWVLHPMRSFSAIIGT